MRSLIPALAMLALSACGTRPVTEAPAMPTIGAQVAALAVAQLGAPYRFGGDTPAGFDCSGLVRFVFAQAGVMAPRTTLAQQHAAAAIAREHLQPGDLVFFRVTEQRVDHVGVYVGAGEFVHAPRSGRAVSRESLEDPWYQRRYAGAGRLAR